MGVIAAIFIIALYAVILFFTIGGYWKTFVKAGQAGWACLIPVYNILVMADIAHVKRGQAWKALAVSFVGTTVYVITIMQTMLNGSAPEFSSSLMIGILIFAASIILTMVFLFPIYKGIALNFGQTTGFAFGLMFLNVIFFAILGFGSAQYLGKGNINNPDILDSDLNI